MDKTAAERILKECLVGNPGLLSSTINGLLRCHKVSVILEFWLEMLEMLTVESKVHFILFSLVFPSFPQFSPLSFPFCMVAAS